jgi:hypothetical protein
MALRLPSMDQGYGGTPKLNPQGYQRGGGTAAKSTGSTTPKLTPLSSAALQAPQTIFPQYTSGSWANLPTGVLGTMPATPAPPTPAPATPTPATGGGALSNPQMSQFLQRYPGLAQYFQSRSNSPLSGLFGGLFGRMA